jgi:hypothetical protein
MSVLPQLERDLLTAAASRHATEGVRKSTIGEAHAGRVKVRRTPHARTPRLRVALLACGAVLASGTIALAATGVILTGAPVPASNQQDANVGDGVPAPGASQLLPLRAADPEGGLPWGMRIVHTTRGEVCLQIGRVEGSELGELGVDGAFGNDGRFHPLSAGALPSLAPDGAQPPDASNISCNLPGEAIVGWHIGLDRSASALPSSSQVAIGPRRDIYFGILGPDAVSVGYSDGQGQHTDAVAPESGAYLIVQPTAPGEQVETGGASIGTYGNAVPSAPLTAIAYRIDGKPCERGPVQPPWATTSTVNTCPQIPLPSAPVQQPELHVPLHVEVVSQEGFIMGIDVSFTAPYAASDASQEYAVQVPDCVTAHNWSGSSQSLERDVAKGETVHIRIGDPFLEQCGAASGPTSVERQTATVEALYRHADGGGSVVIGSTVIDEPAGTRPAPVGMALAGSKRAHLRLLPGATRR